jgi:hypothetical protein
MSPTASSIYFFDYAGRFAFHSALWYRYGIRTATRANALPPSGFLNGRQRRRYQSAWNFLYVLGMDMEFAAAFGDAGITR